MLVTMVEQDSLTLTEDEAALYDRQIRLWGLDAQKRYMHKFYNRYPLLTASVTVHEFELPKTLNK